MNRYEKYKDSGIAWIGEIPEMWSVLKLSGLYAVRNEKVSDKDFPALSVTMQGIVPQLATAAKTDDGDNRKLVRIGDFAINSRSDRRGSCGVSAHNGSVSLINTILTPRSEMSSKFYNWLLRTSLFSDEYYKWGHGIVDDLWTTRWQEMKNISVVFPPIIEQEAIAEFLDGKCEEVDRLVGLQQAMIEELVAYKQSVITECVTKGLDPSAPLRDSGIPWIGSIPAHWEVKPFKTIYRLGKGLTITKADLTRDGIAVINYGQIHSKLNTGTAIQDSLIKYVPEKYLGTDTKSLVFEGDIIFADTSEDLDGCGNCIYMDRVMELFAGYHTIIARNTSGYVNKFLPYLFKTDLWRGQLRTSVSGVKVLSISQKILASTTVIIPPLQEQQAIADHLDRKCEEIDNLIAIKREKIEQLKEYKKSVIFEYVTGKKRVN